MTVFDANTFGPDEAPVPDSQENGMRLTQDVLIDLDGNRSVFRIGWYDYDEREWILHADGVTVGTHMRWSFLPLAIYETNPELRKTVKI